MRGTGRDAWVFRTVMVAAAGLVGLAAAVGLHA
jgi:hypothetical protein